MLAVRQERDDLAKKALAGIEKVSVRSSRARKLKAFIAKWSPAPAAKRARELLDEMAAEMLSKIKGTKGRSRRRSMLKTFVRTYGDTPAGAEAKKLLEEETGARRRR